MLLNAILALGCVFAGPDGVSNKRPITGEEETTQTKKTRTEKPSEMNGDTVVATVNGENLTLDTVRKIFDLLTLDPAKKLSDADEKKRLETFDQLFPQLRSQQITMALITQAATKAGLTTNPLVQLKINQCQIAVPNQIFYQTKVEEKTTPELLNKRRDALAKKIDLAVIMHTKKESLEAALKRLNKGEKFDAVVKDVSMNPNKDNGGKLGFISKLILDQLFIKSGKEHPGDKIFNTPNAAVVQKVFETVLRDDEGATLYAIVKVLDKKSEELPPVDQIKMDLQKSLQAELAKEVEKDVWKTAKVSLLSMDSEGKSIKDPVDFKMPEDNTMLPMAG